MKKTELKNAIDGGWKPDMSQDYEGYSHNFTRVTKVSPNEPIGKCPTCGIDLYQTMHYSCSRNDCTIFPKAVM